GSGVVTVAPWLQHSPLVFATPAQLSPGTFGACLQFGVATGGPQPPGRLHPLVPPVGVGADVADGQLTIRNTRSQIVAFQVLITGPPSLHLQLHYALAAGSADLVEHGAGCYDRSRSWYEAF